MIIRRDVTFLQVSVGEILRVELDPHPTEPRVWHAHQAYSTDIGKLESVKTGSEGLIKVVMFLI